MSYNASNISVLEGLDPVRKRPVMYVGSTSVKGLNHLIYEIMDNSVDEHLAGFCSHIIISINKDGSANVIHCTYKNAFFVNRTDFFDH